MKTGPYFALALIAATGEAFAGSPLPMAQDCCSAAGGTAAAYNFRCKGLPISEAEGAERYLNLSPRQQVAADVAAEEFTSQRLRGVSKFPERVH
jgi:hypothetical protein